MHQPVRSRHSRGGVESADGLGGGSPGSNELVEALQEWLNDFELVNIDKDVLRSLIRSPLKDFLQNFCLPYVRSDTWISTMRSNMDLIADSVNQSELTEPKTSKIQVELEECIPELASLEEQEQSLLANLKCTYGYESFDISLLTTFIESETDRIKKDVDRKYFMSLRKSREATRCLWQSLRSIDNNGEIEDHLITEELSFTRIPNDFKEFNLMMRDLIKKFFCDEKTDGYGNTDCKVNIIKKIVQNQLNKLNCLADESWLEAIDDDGCDALDLPNADFSCGLKEFNQIIFNKLLEWSQFHLDLHDINMNETNSFFKNNQSGTIMEDSWNESSEFSNESTLMKLLNEEETLKQTLQFYKHVNAEEYTKKILTTDSIKSHHIKIQLSVADSPGPTLSILSSNVNYEVLSESILNELQQLRTQISDGVTWFDGTFGPQIDQYYEPALSLLNEENEQNNE